MSEISLYVTQAVVEHTKANPNQKQIAYKDATPDIATYLQAVNRDQRITLRLGGLIMLNVADTNAIWMAHNTEAAADFDALFSLLSRHPGKSMRFVCDVP